MDVQVKMRLASFLAGIVTAVLMAAGIFGWMSGQIVGSHRETHLAQDRLGKCVDIASDAREYMFDAEEAWIHVATDLSYCEMWTEREMKVCLPQEFFTSYGYGGPLP